MKTQQKKSLETNDNPKARPSKHQDPCNAYRINGREASGGIQKYPNSTTQATALQLKHTHAFIHTHTRAHMLVPSLCAVETKRRQTQTPQFSAGTSTHRFAPCPAIRMYILLYFTGLFAFRTRDGSRKVRVCTSEINELNLCQKITCFRK